MRYFLFGLRIISIASVVCVCLAAANCVLIPRPIEKKERELKTRATDEAIRGSEQLRVLNEVCTSVKLSPDFEFVWKGGLDDQKLSLEYHYSSKLPFADVRPLFLHHFASRGWSVTDLSDRYPKQIEFSNGEYRVAVSMISEKYPESNLGVYCEKLGH